MQGGRGDTGEGVPSPRHEREQKTMAAHFDKVTSISIFTFDRL